MQSICFMGYGLDLLHLVKRSWNKKKKNISNLSLLLGYQGLKEIANLDSKLNFFLAKTFFKLTKPQEFNKN